MSASFFLIKVPNWTNVQVSLQHGMWQVPVRDAASIQPRDILNAEFMSGRVVVLIIALETGKQFAGYGFQKQAIGPPASPQAKTCVFPFEWKCVFPRRGKLLPYAEVAHIVTPDGRPVSSLRSFDRIPEETARVLIDRLTDSVNAASAVSAPSASVPISQRTSELLQRASASWQGGVVLAWLVEAESSLMVVRRMPLSQLLEASSRTMGGIDTIDMGNGDKVCVMELATFCSGLVQGNLVCVESLFQSVVAGEPSVVESLKELRTQWLSKQLLFNVKDQLLGRDGLKGWKTAIAKKEASHARGARLRWLLSVLTGLLDANSPHIPSFKEIISIEDSQLEGKVLETVQASDAHLPDCVSVESQQRLGDLLLKTRLDSAGTLPAPISWKGTLPPTVASVCPWPLIVLGKRTGPEGSQLIGVFGSSVSEWLRSPALRSIGERGWGDLSVRGNGFVLHELGRFVEMLVFGNPFVLELVFLDRLGTVLHKTAEWDDFAKRFMGPDLFTPRAIMQVMSAVQAQLKLLISAKKPFGESAVALAGLLKLAREYVVERVGPSEAGDSYNEWNFWKEPIMDLEVATAPADGPACMPKDKIDVEANLEVDHSGLREVLIELDELRPKWMDKFPHPSLLQQRLQDWFVAVRLGCLAHELLEKKK